MYRIEEDRLLLRLSFKEEDGRLQELRAWLTRRLLRKLWPTLMGVMEAQVVLDLPQAAHAKADIVGMEHETSIAQVRANGGFNSSYDDAVQGFPLGEVPLLVTTVDFTQAAGQPVRVHWKADQGKSFEVTLTPTLLHALCALLVDASAQAEWDIALNWPAALQVQAHAVLN